MYLTLPGQLEIYFVKEEFLSIQDSLDVVGYLNGRTSNKNSAFG